MGSARAARRDRQVVRILGILKILTEGGRPTVHSLAARFRVRRETIYRDLHALEAIGYPLAGDEAGHLSRPRFAPDLRPTMPPLLLSRQELTALVWALKQAEPRQPFQAALSTAVPKLQALTAGKDGQTALAIEGALGGWQRGVKDYSGFEPTILRLVEAIVSRRRGQVAYQAPWRDRPRQAHPPRGGTHRRGGGGVGDRSRGSLGGRPSQARDSAVRNRAPVGQPVPTQRR